MEKGKGWPETPCIAPPELPQLRCSNQANSSGSWMPNPRLGRTMASVLIAIRNLHPVTLTGLLYLSHFRTFLLSLVPTPIYSSGCCSHSVRVLLFSHSIENPRKYYRGKLPLKVLSENLKLKYYLNPKLKNYLLLKVFGCRRNGCK